MKLFSFESTRTRIIIITAVIIIFRISLDLSIPLWVKCTITMLTACYCSFCINYYSEKKAWGSVAILILGIISFVLYYSYKFISSPGYLGML